MSGDVRPGADEPSVLEQLGFSVPPSTPDSSAPAPSQNHLPPHARAPIDVSAAAATTRREARALEQHRPAASKAKSKSAERRIRAVQKSYAKPKRRGAAAPRPVVPTGSTRPAASTTKSTSRARTIGSRVLSFAAMLFAGALAVGMSVPANAFGTAPTEGGNLLSAIASGGGADKVGAQTLDVAADAAPVSAARDKYSVTSWADMLKLQYGTRDYSYEMGDPNGPIRWPFPYPVPISSGFGERAAPCHGCSSMHMGVDFTPGEGAPIYATASGVVKEHKDDTYGFGNHVIIDHGDLLGDGTQIETLYAHMQHNSVALKVGDKIEVGDFIGTVGMTGTATGFHLHFEVHVDGTPVDPFAWLQANTK
jgi:murein DD-endopeptidase MepM/ murein hydrolase activator NlpD